MLLRVATDCCHTGLAGPQILRAVHADDVAYRAVVAHLIDVGLLSGSEVRRKGGFDGLWGSTLKEVNDKLAQYGGRLSLDELDVEAVERWVTEKKARMRSLPYRQRDRASRTGYIPADEDTLSLGLITFPSEYLEFVDGEGGLWDPEHPAGSPPPAGKGKANQLRQPSRQPIPGTGLEEPLLSSALLPPGERPLRGKATPASSVRHAMSALWQGGGGGGLPPTGSEVQFVLAQTLLGAAPAVSPDENRLGMAWEVDPQEYTADAAAREEDKEDGPAREPLSEMARPASRYSSAETIHFMCRIGMAAWPLLVLSSVLVVASVGLHLYQLRVQSLILNLALAGDSPAFMEKIVLLAKVCIAYVTANWLSSLALQLYLRQAMQQLYTGLFQHVLFQDSTFYDRISASELAMRCGVDMMNLRVLVGFLVQKMVKGLTQVIAGVVLLASFASPALGWGFTAVIGAAVWVSVGELFLVSLFIRARHRIARSALGRLYGFSYDVFSSIHGVISMALQRSFADSYGYLAASYFHAAMVLAMWVASHEFFLETLFSAGVTVGLMYIGGSHVLAGTLSVGALYAMLRYTAVVESGYTALSEGVARFYASYGSLEHVIDLQKRGQLTNRGKAAVLEALEREDANRQPQQEAGEGLGDAGGSGPWPNWTRRLTAASWAGGVRCRDVIYGYKGRPGNVLFAFNLDVPAGELVLVTGAPASGRSTLLHLLHLDIIAGGGSVQFLTTAGTWLTYQTTSTDRYDMQQCMGYVSPQSCIEAVFYATVQENMVCGCSVACLPSVVDCQEAAAVTGLDADVAQMPDGYQTLVGEASRVDLAIMARLRLGITRLLLLDAPRLVLIDDADRFLTAVPRLPEVVGRLKQAGASVVLTASSSSADALRAALPTDMHHLVLERGRLRPAV
ncbi:hypothetical protein CHLNCDRAFT_57175 [Chlorella variabilis]|uniref:ABC transmembrane type-1 domain-containing protein n=1 Tax=Chlorella variabilis TaxID=554065 RepID=E1Z8I6_CHLVA|nr:hypothetical protein CHLNCDRAFT_57175 [Chlorella variabilis]EFN57342.1 hypothetical protein CHLNCDRAFT_57175 [Chlorella variabilis]|eukprot:XP_005849444.1 hypothetical protein CHLNCDRAFT_57175 [Chlorella variabilis]